MYQYIVNNKIIYLLAKELYRYITMTILTCSFVSGVILYTFLDLFSATILRRPFVPCSGNPLSSRLKILLPFSTIRNSGAEMLCSFCRKSSWCTNQSRITASVTEVCWNPKFSGIRVFSLGCLEKNLATQVLLGWLSTNFLESGIK